MQVRGFSLRGVARGVGTTVQSPYHYFDSRDDLLTALVVDGHADLAAVVATVAEVSRGEPAVERRVAAAGGFRSWAPDNRSTFLLLYGSPVPGFDAVHGDQVEDAAFALTEPLLDVLLDGWCDGELAALPAPGRGPGVVRHHDGGHSVSIGAPALFVELRARIHGLVMLELLGHLYPFDEVAAQLFDTAIRRMSDDTDAAQRATGVTPPDSIPSGCGSN